MAAFGAAPQPSRNQDSLPTPLDPSGQCPWCKRTAAFEVEAGWGWMQADHDETGWIPTMTAAMMRCQGCKRGTVVISDELGQGIHWYPTPGAGPIDKDVNDRVYTAYDEGMRCLSVGANRAAAVMFRSTLSLFIKDKGSEKCKRERNLKKALSYMRADGDLHKSLWDWADHLRQLGNEGAHPEDYDDVTDEEAGDLGDFVRHLIRHEYEMPARLLRARGVPADRPS